MYLYKNCHSNYYSRISFPKRLRERGFPAEIRVSLRTKTRQTAIDRNLTVVHLVRQQMKHILVTTSVEAFMAELRCEIKSAIERHFNYDFTASTLIPSSTDLDKPNNPIELDELTLIEWLERFIERKKSEGITRKSVNLLNTRIKHFVENCQCLPRELSTKKASDYLGSLMQTDKSIKSVKEYVSAAKQFCN